MKDCMHSMQTEGHNHYHAGYAKFLAEVAGDNESGNDEQDAKKKENDAKKDADKAKDECPAPGTKK